MIAALFMTVGCIDIPAMNGLIDRIVPEESKSYQTIEVWGVEGNFAPDPDQDSDALIKARGYGKRSFTISTNGTESLLGEIRT